MHVSNCCGVTVVSKVRKNVGRLNFKTNDGDRKTEVYVHYSDV